jgi:hypothetical protein
MFNKNQCFLKKRRKGTAFFTIVQEKYKKNEKYLRIW